MFNTKFEKSKKGLNHDYFLRATYSAGFTLTELMIVITIMAFLSALIVANINGQRLNRNLNIAQNELVTHLRKIQSYTLASRNIGANKPAQFYIMKFDFNKPTEYVIQAMYDISSSPKVQDLETIKLARGIRLANGNPTVTINGTQITQQCALVAFKVPFAKSIVSDGCSPATLPSSPYSPVDGDDYKKILQYVTNTVTGTAYGDAKINVRIGNFYDSSSRTVIINGITGSITAQ